MIRISKSLLREAGSADHAELRWEADDGYVQTALHTLRYLYRKERGFLSEMRKQQSVRIPVSFMPQGDQQGRQKMHGLRQGTLCDMPALRPEDFRTGKMRGMRDESHADMRKQTLRSGTVL